MTQEHKDLLLKDLCTRLPYGVKVEYNSEMYGVLGIAHGRALLCKPLSSITEKDCPLIEDVKPYLFPLSSITEEQKNELREMEWSFDNSTICNIIECFGTYRAYVDHSCCSELIDWFIKNHIDYRGLIPKGLANDATGLNIY